MQINILFLCVVIVGEHRSKHKLRYILISKTNITVIYLCQDMFSPGKYAKSISGNAHYTSLQESERLIRHEEFISHLKDTLFFS